MVWITSTFFVEERVGKRWMSGQLVPASRPQRESFQRLRRKKGELSRIAQQVIHTYPQCPQPKKQMFEIFLARSIYFCKKI